MKKIGVALYNNFRGSLDSFLSFLHNLGVDYVEIGKEWIPRRGDIRKTKDILDIYDLKANLHVSQHFNLAELDDKKWKRNILGVLGDLGVCYDLQIENAIMHCGWIKNDDVISNSINEAFDRFAEAYNIISDYGKEFCVNIGLENQCKDAFKYYLFQDVNNLNKLEELIGKEILFVLDVGHLGRLGVPLEQMMGRIDDNLIGIHLHDFDKYGRDHLPVGTGNLQLKELFEMIKGKDLFITLENKSVPHIKYSILHSPLNILINKAVEHKSIY